MSSVAGGSCIILFSLISLLTSWRSSVISEAQVTHSAYKCTYVRTLLSATTFNTPSILFKDAVNYTTAHDICSTAVPPLEKCCAITYSSAINDLDYSELEQLRVKWFEPIFADFLKDSMFFRTFFVDSLNITMTALDSNFMSSYGYNYQTNKDFFIRFFANLEGYMLGQRQNLSALVDDFFHELLIRIVRLLLFAKSDSDRVAADCISAELEKKRPFDRIPESIKKMTLRAFPPARIIANALLIGSESIFTIIQQVKFSYSCHVDWMKLRYCGLCVGEIGTALCPNACRLTVARCLNEYTPLIEPWTQFIDNLIAVTERLRDSDSFPQVNRPLQIHITDAIMNFQRLFSHIEQPLLKSCNYRGAQPLVHLRRQRRQLRHSFGSPPAPSFPSVPETVDYFQALPSLANQAKLMREKYRPIRSLFETAETVFCSRDLLRASNRTSVACWDGERVLSKDRNLITPPSRALVPNPIVTRLVTRLRHVTKMLRDILQSDADPDFLPPDAPFWLDKSNSLLDSQSSIGPPVQHAVNSLHTGRMSHSRYETSTPPVRPSVPRTSPPRRPPSGQLNHLSHPLPSEGSGFAALDETESFVPGWLPIPAVFRQTMDRTSPESSAPVGVAWDDEDWPLRQQTLVRQPGPIESRHHAMDTPRPGESFVGAPHTFWTRRGQEAKSDSFSEAGSPGRVASTLHDLVSNRLPPYPGAREYVPPSFVRPPNQLWIPQSNQMRHGDTGQLTGDSYNESPNKRALGFSSSLTYTLLFTYSFNLIAV